MRISQTTYPVTAEKGHVAFENLPFSRKYLFARLEHASSARGGGPRTAIISARWQSSEYLPVLGSLPQNSIRFSNMFHSWGERDDQHHTMTRGKKATVWHYRHSKVEYVDRIAPGRSEDGLGGLKTVCLAERLPGVNAVCPETQTEVSDLQLFWWAQEGSEVVVRLVDSPVWRVFRRRILERLFNMVQKDLVVLEPDEDVVRLDV